MQVGDLTPNIGLQWYLLTETFPHMRGAVAMLCPTLALVSALALSTRLAHRPLFLAALLCALSAMLKPYPSISDVGLYMVRRGAATGYPPEANLGCAPDRMQ